MIYSVENMINIVILVLLVAMIIYCMILNRRLKAFRTIKQEMGDIINKLNVSTNNAEKAIVKLKDSVSKQEERLRKKLLEASDMADELDMINKTGSNLADRIEQGLVSDKKDKNENLASEQHGLKFDKTSLSDLDEELNETKSSKKLRENLRNVR